MRKPPKEYWSLFELIHERTVSYLKSRIEPGLLNSVFGLPDTESEDDEPAPTKSEQYWLTWLREFSEIDSAMERLDQSVIYLSTFPSSKALRFYRLSEADWLRYHVETYLQETYILNERLRRFLAKLERTAIRHSDREGISAARWLQDNAKATLKSVVTVRGAHVHEKRFRDTELADLNVLVLLSRDNKLRLLRPFRAVQYQKALRKWRKQLFQNNKETRKLCGLVFRQATKILERNEPR